jgi:peptide chain release factor subunit 1
MADTITWDHLRNLAAFRATNGCAVSFYLDLEPSTAPTPADAQTRFNALLNEAEKSDAANAPELTHDQRRGLQEDFGRIRDYFANEFTREGTQGLALFAAGADGFWYALPLGEPVQASATIDRIFNVAPLVPLVGRGDGALVAVVSRERGDVYRLRSGRLVELADHSEEQPGRHDQGGWSQARFQRHIDELAAEHMRTVAAELDRQVRRSGNGTAVVVVCAEEVRSQFADLLSQEAQGALVGWAQVEAHAGPADLLDAVRPLVDEARVRREQEALDRWREETAKDARASAGWHKTLEAASDARVELLLVHEGAEREAYVCPECGRAAADAGDCPLDGTPLARQARGVDVAVRQTLANGGTVLTVAGPDLGPAEGIGALLRF